VGAAARRGASLLLAEGVVNLLSVHVPGGLERALA
jgi:hypothetical protein